LVTKNNIGIGGYSLYQLQPPSLLWKQDYGHVHKIKFCILTHAYFNKEGSRECKGFWTN